MMISTRWPITLLLISCSAATPVLADEDNDFAAATDRFAGDGNPAVQATVYPIDSPTGPAAAISLGNPFGIEVRGDAVWITTIDDHCVWQTDVHGRQLVRVAGSGTQGFRGDGGPATEAQFNWPHEVRVNEHGDLFIADTRNHVIRRVDAATGIVTTIAGNGQEGFAGDGGSGPAVRFRQPHSVVLDGRGNALVADTLNHRVRNIELETGTVTTIAGNGERALPGEGDLAATSPLAGPRSLAVDSDWIWLALREGNSIWRIDRKEGTIHRVAGTGQKGYTGDGGSPLTATFNGPKGLAIDSRGRVLVVDTENQVVRRIDVERDLIETVVGGKAALPAWQLQRPHGIAPLAGSQFLVADSEHHRVLRCR